MREEPPASGAQPGRRSKPARAGGRSLANFLDDQRELLLERWLREDEALVAPRRFSRDDLIDSMPRFLDELSGALRREQGLPSDSRLPEQSEVSEQHGRQRMQLGLDAAVVVREYALLRDVLLALVGEANLVITNAEARLLSRCIDTGAAEAVSQYVIALHDATAEARRHEQRYHLKRRQAEHEEQRLHRELRSAHEQTSAERRRLTELFDSAPAIVVAMRGPQHVFELVTPLYQRTVGIDRQLLGRPVREALPELVEQGFVDMLDRIYRTGEPFTGYELKIRLDRTGSGRLEDTFFNVVYQPYRNANGEIIGIDAFGFEVTEQVLARQRAEAAVAELDAIFQSVPDALYVADANGMRRANRPALEMFGFDTLEELNRSLATLSRQLDTRRADTGEPIPPEEQAFTHALQGRPDVQDVRIRHPKTGEERVVRAACAPIRVAGEVIGAVGINTDITDRSEGERVLRDRTELEQQLIGIVSHDLRNPLTAIVLGVQSLLRRDVLDERATKSLLRVEGAAERAARLIRDLLDFTQARLGAGIVVKREPLDLHQLTRRVLEEAQMTFPERDIEVRTEGDGRGRWDGDRIAQVLSNLVSNAVKYGDAEHPVVVTSRGQDDSVMLEVHNEGEPIRPEVLPRLFQPMQRGSHASDASARSVGLGLYIVDALVRAHGGTVEVRSSREQGTSFIAHLPRDRG